MALINWLKMIASLVFLALPNQLLSQSLSTHFDFTSFNGKEADLIYQGHAHIPTAEAAVRLTSASPANATYFRPLPLPNSAGRVLYSPPIRLWDKAGGRQANFQTVVKGFIGNYYTSAIADGMAFFIAPVNTTIPSSGSTGGNMGLYNSSGESPVPIFAVELDVFVNDWDPNFRHVGINFNSRESVAVASWDAGGFIRDVEVTITYDARRLVSVVANASSTHFAIQPVIARVDRVVDLKRILPEWVQIGISASTGNGPAALHDVRAWSFTSFMVPDGIAVVQDT